MLSETHLNKTYKIIGAESNIKQDALEAFKDITGYLEDKYGFQFDPIEPLSESWDDNLIERGVKFTVVGTCERKTKFLKRNVEQIVTICWGPYKETDDFQRVYTPLMKVHDYSWAGISPTWAVSNYESIDKMLEINTMLKPVK